MKFKMFTDDLLFFSTAMPHIPAVRSCIPLTASSRSPAGKQLLVGQIDDPNRTALAGKLLHSRQACRECT